ncbi:hypothetical protein ACFE04_014254 [Oxalis oulophora]
MSEIIESPSYDSLADILPTSPSDLRIDIENMPIKNPLLKTAALAYLQPIRSPHVVQNKGFFGKLKDMFSCGESCCIGWLKECGAYGAVPSIKTTELNSVHLLASVRDGGCLDLKSSLYCIVSEFHNKMIACSDTYILRAYWIKETIFGTNRMLTKKLLLDDIVIVDNFLVIAF